MTADTIDASVIVPTIGRAELLERCLASVTACRPRAADVAVVDQSDDPRVREAIEQFSALGVRRVPCDGRGVSLGRNVGLREAHHEIVLVTDDDCTVDETWIASATGLLGGADDLLVTGRVMPVGDPRSVTSAKTDLEPHDFTGETHCGAIYPNNMAFSRTAALELGGFDERLRHAEDNDFCFRWLRAGLRLHYRPEPVVWHHDWRAPDELGELYGRYWFWQGVFYAKHLRQGERAVMRFIREDVREALRYLVARAVRGKRPWPDSRARILRRMPAGVRAGLRRTW